MFAVAWREFSKARSGRSALVSRSIGIVPAPPPEDGFGTGLAGFASQLWWERRWRTRHFPAELFGEPAWDLMLSLYAAETQPADAEPRKPHLAACVPPQAARRHILNLRSLGIVAERAADAPRGAPLALAPAARERMGMMLAAILLQRERLADNPAAAGDARLTLATARLYECLAEMDALDLTEAGAHLSQAIAAAEKEAARRAGEEG
jgi:hypothetical protein